MREQEFKARDKKVQKMTRDGLTEKNLTQGTEQRISSRLADVSFDRTEPEDTAAGRRAASRTQRKQQQKQGAQPQDFVAQEEPADRFADATAPEVWGPLNAPVSMRDAGDAPLVPNRPPGEAQEPRRKKQRRKQNTPTQPDKQGEEPEETTPPAAEPATHRRLNTERGNDTGKKPDQRGRRYQVRRLAQGQQSEESTAPEAAEHGRLRFESEEIPESGEKTSIRHDKRYQVRRMVQGEQPGEAAAPEPTERGRLRFVHEQTPDGGESPSKRAALKKKQAERFRVVSVKPEDAPRLKFDRSELPPEERATISSGAGSDSEESHSTQNQTGTARQQKKYNKAQRRVEKADRKLEKAQSKIPTRRKIRLEKQYDSESGKIKRRLQFETEQIPEYEKPPLPKRVVKGVLRGAKTAAVMKTHQKIREVEHENVAVEAAHKGEFTTERAVGRLYRWNKQRLHTKPYRMERKARRNVSRANADMAYQQLLKDNPELQKKAFAKWIQKKKLKRKYAAAAREAQKTAHHTQQVLNATGQIIRAVAEFVAANKAVLGVVALAVLLVVLCGSMFSSCTAMLSGVQSAIISTCYVADDKEINDSELKYTELETDLQKDIDDTETNYPGFDEYRYNIGEIGHNPYELMAYLSAVFEDFTYAQVEAELNRLFGLQYTLTREEIVEIRTYTDEDGDEHEYEWYVLQTTLTVRPLGDIIAGSLSPGDQTDRYGVYMQTYGNRQCYGNPFDFAWLGYVTSPYGYRIHPITGEKNLHRGMDIGVASGTPIKAIQDGRVVSAGDAGDYGLCVVIEGEDGYQSRYAHCSSLSVSAGQEVKRGDVIAAVGSTGNRTGPHLHLEVTHNGEYLNPYYFVDNGGDGLTPGGGAAGSPDIPDYSGEPMGDGTFEAMLAEAEKYLGYPYVWGGSSPSTSFDCSGFVSWVINQSGVGSVGRQTASGLYNLCTPVSKENMQPGDLIFFTGTYSSPTPVSHVGIYVGGGRMIHCGDPISYANINSNYWSSHYYSGGRLP